MNTFYGNYYLYLCVYVVIRDYLCVYIVIGDYLCLFLINVCKIADIYFYCMLNVCKKTNIPLNIYPHNTLRNNLEYI